MSARAVRTPVLAHPYYQPQLYSPVADTAPSRSYTYKKVTKPLLERRRRARISKCLDELKEILIDRVKISEESINRLEKADILELAVEHLQTLQTADCANRYQEGFNECAETTFHFLETLPEVDESLSERLVDHLETCTGPLTIDVPRFHLTFSPPVSPLSLTSSPQPLHQLSLSEFNSASGLLMQAKKRTSSTNGRPKKLMKSAHDLSGICTPPAEEKDTMWRPW